MIDALDVASLEQFQLELVAAGFEPCGDDQREWVGPIAQSLRELTDAEMMRVVFLDGWPFQHPRLFVDLLDEEHVTVSGDVCLWETGASPQEWKLITVDFIHVLEYLWKAAWCFYKEGDPAAERWVHDKARGVLAGKAGIVAAAIRRKATRLNLEPTKREGADRCADYLLAKRPYLDYPTALSQGSPIATGVIEGACRHLTKDRMDITGARWSLESAEAILKLRALISNQDFDPYWTYHLNQEHRRSHATRYALDIIPQPA